MDETPLIKFARSVKINLSSGKRLSPNYFQDCARDVENIKARTSAEERQKSVLKKLLQKQYEVSSEYDLYRRFIAFIMIAAFRTAETIIHRLADTPIRKLNRRNKYAWTQLKYNSDGTVSHNFIHNVGNVPNEYIETLKVEAPRYMGKGIVDTTAPYFQDEKFRGKSEDIEDMVLPDTAKDDSILKDIHQPTSYDQSPCGVHDGMKLRTDCVLCKAIIPEEDRPVIISRAFQRKINVTENLLKFLAIQQDKRKAREDGNQGSQ